MRNLRPGKTVGAEQPCGVAFDRASGDAVIAERLKGGGFDVKRVGRDEAQAAFITAPELRTVIAGWSAHTDRTPLAVSSSDSDEHILTQLIEAQAQNEGTMNLRFTFSRTRDGRVVLTQALRAEAEETVAGVRSWASGQSVTAAQPLTVKVDTATRCVMRLWLEGPVSRGEIKADSTVAVLVVGEDGYGMGLWGTDSGFVYETGEKFKSGAVEVQLAGHIHAKLSSFVSAATVGKLGLHPVEHLIVAASPKLKESLGGFLNESAALREIAFERLLMPVEGGDGIVEELDLAAALAAGASLDSELVPAANLSSDLAAQLAATRASNEAAAHAQQAGVRKMVAYAAAAPLALALIFLLTAWALRASDASALDRSIAEEKATAAKLRQAGADYEAAKANFAVIGNLITQITSLRDKQSDAYQLLVELNSRWPQGTPWYVSEINSTGNQIEVKGRARDEQALTVFVRALENSEGVFTSVTESHSDPNNSVGGGGLPPALSQNGQQQKSGTVVQFFVKATYTPRNDDSGVGAAAPRVPVLNASQEAKGKSQ